MANAMLAVGILAGVACGFGAVTAPEVFYPGYLQAFGFWLAISIGSLGLLCVHQLTGGEWGVKLGPLFRAAANTLPLVALLFLPIAFGMGNLYSWADPKIVENSPLLQSKEAYLNTKFFFARAAAYFLVWLGLSYFLRGAAKRSNARSGVSLLLLIITFSFAALDWFMSTEPEWFSSLYGLIFVTGSLVSTLSFTVMVLMKRQPEIKREIRHDFGKLLFMGVMLWGYLNFSQYLIIWSGQLPEEMFWYHHRMVGGWNWVGLAVVLGLFAIPFCVLLPQSQKQSPNVLIGVCLFLLVLRSVDFCWLVGPAFQEHVPLVPSWELAAYLGIGGLWLWAFFFFYGKSMPQPLGVSPVPAAKTEVPSPSQVEVPQDKAIRREDADVPEDK